MTTATNTAIDTAVWIARAENALTELAAALSDAVTCRLACDTAARLLAEREAELLATVAGSNEAARKAALTLALRDDAIGHALTLQSSNHRATRETADARVTVAREELRLARAVLALAAGGEVME